MKIVQDNKSLKNLCKLLKTQKVIYLDTEFKRDRTYWPKLCTIQFKTQRNVYLVDMLLIEQINMNALKEILIDYLYLNYLLTILMQLKNKLLAQRIYLLLGALFITSLVVSNLIFQKFFYWYPFDIEIF